MIQKSKRLLIIKIILATLLVLFYLINNSVALAEDKESVKDSTTEARLSLGEPVGFNPFEEGEDAYISGHGIDKNDKEAFFKLTKKVAEQGDSDAQYNLGVMYDNGEGVAQDKKEALKWYREAAEQGDSDAQYNLGVMYDNGEGVAQDKKEALKWYREAAEQGDSDAQYNLGVMYDNGEGVAQDKKEALKWYREAADQGDSRAQITLGNMYDIGKGVLKDEKEAVMWFRKAANQGNASAQGILGLMYYYGKNVAQDKKEALKWYREAAEQGDSRAQYNLGVMYHRGEGVLKDDKEAVKWTRKAANQGFASAQFTLGLMYYRGEGVLKDDKEAIKWYRKAAKQEHAIAQFNLGLMYFSGEGVLKDDKEAVKWIRNAANQGFASAQFNLGLKHYKGEGVLKDVKEAVKWYRKAAKQGHSWAQVMLGDAYFEGEGIPKDYVRAYAWTNLAAAQGHSSAVELNKVITEKMSKSQIAKAQELSRALNKGEESPSASSNNDESGQIKGVGTGFFITRDGHILTCYHVVKGADSISINLEGKTYDAELVQADSHNDLALLKIHGSFPALSFSPSRTATLGDEVFTVGFPNPSLQGLAAKFTKGDINSLTGVQDDPRLYQISAPIHPGNSGGALINTRSEVVGCVVSTLNAKTAFKISGSIPQNVNYAIKSTYILAFLDAIPNVSSKLVQPDKKRKKTFSEIVEKVKASTVMVVIF